MTARHNAGTKGASWNPGLLWGLAIPVAVSLPLRAPLAACLAAPALGSCAELGAGAVVQIFTWVGTLLPLLTILLRCGLGVRGVRTAWLLPDHVVELCTVFVLWNTYTVWYALYMARLRRT